MKQKTIFQQDLFGAEKMTFMPQHFESMLRDSGVEECISDAILDACRLVQDSETYCHLSLKTQSVSISEVAMHLLQGKLAENQIDVDFRFDTEGDLRSYFIMGDYIFILHKDDLRDNNTRQGRRVKNQQLSKHVITIIYKLNALRSDDASISLQYWLGDNFVYSKALDISRNKDFTANIDTEYVAPANVKLRFKKEKKNVSGE